MKTEEDARMTRCCNPPAGRLEMVDLDDWTINEFAGRPVYLCDASRCQAWRWVGEQEANPDYPKDDRPFVPKFVRGYCGLAGKP